ncbi:MAG: hypothetical protein HQL21_08185 [Candidatus Omnitrophica bacterium]|nr:hypothetical protein [Candidatus Omnitrophota bacterium]
MNTHRLFLFTNPILFTLSIAITLILTLIGAISLPFSKTMYIHTGYYFILGLVITYVFILIFEWRNIGPHANQFWAKNWQGALFAFCISSLIFISVPTRHRVLNDELHLLSVAKTMTLEQKVQRDKEVWKQNPEFLPSPRIDKRPILFPFFISLLHTILGYQLSNIFIVNYLSLCGFLFGLYCFLRRYLARTWCMAALLLVVAQPIIPLCATSGGLETCNLAFIMLSFLSLRYFLDTPSTSRLQLLILHLLLLANIQYASALFLILILGVIGLMGHIKKPLLQQPSLIPITSLFLLPLIWQRIIMLQTIDSNFPTGTTASAFGLKYLVQNTALLPEYFFDLTAKAGGLAGIINIIGTIALVLLISRFLWTTRSLPKDLLTLIIAIITPLSVISFLVLLYYGGINNHPMNARLYLLWVITLSVSPIILAKILLPELHRHGAIILLFSAILFLFYHPVATTDPLFHKGKYVKEFEFLCDFWKKRPLKNNLIIYRNSPDIDPLLNDAISIQTARKWKTLILKQHKQNMYNNIYVIQRFSCSTGIPYKKDILDNKFSLATLAEKKIYDDICFRIAIVK